MFTGIVQAVGTVASLAEARLNLSVPDAWPDDPWQIGESLAVNGCCLTVVKAHSELEFDVSPETFSRTSLQGLGKGAKVNLERAMRPTDRFGGHIVQGHVDTVGTLASRNGSFCFSVGEEWSRYLVDKGSVAIDGVSLTVVKPESGEFTVAVVPHTLSVTTLGDMRPGHAVNVEFDVLAKYALNLR